jgi:hypothetical protein
MIKATPAAPFYLLILARILPMSDTSQRFLESVAKHLLSFKSAQKT